MTLQTTTSSLAFLALLGQPFLFVLAALLVRQRTVDQSWFLGKWISLTGFFSTTVALVIYVLAIMGTVPGLFSGEIPIAYGWGYWFRFDLPGILLLLLINLIGFVVLRFSHRYLSGDSGQRRFQQAVHGITASVSLLVVSNNLFVIAVTWLLTSLLMHRLLLFYPDRPQVVLAAHKKFLFSRLADVIFFAAIAFVYFEIHSLRIDQLEQHITHNLQGTLTPELIAASLLVGLAAILKCAQMPFHGWLIQVMEAPTPVSAVLHAGVVNLGGFVLIRFASLVNASEPVQYMLVLGGAMSVFLAGLAMTAQSSIKLSLAWSTCAQMGFMLIQCGLGLYPLALLHLLAHSLYKAQCFLSAGRMVDKRLPARLLGVKRKPSFKRWLLSPVLLALLLATVVGFTEFSIGSDPAKFLMLLFFALGGVMLLNDAPLRGMLSNGKLAFALMWRVSALTGLYVLWHWSGWILLDGNFGKMSAPTGLIAIVAVLALAAYLLWGFILSYPTHRLTRRLKPLFAAGLFLDEWFTRLTFQIWPPAELPETRRMRSRSSLQNKVMETGL